MKPDVRYGDGSIRTRVRKNGEISYQARWHDGVRWRSKTFHGGIEQAEDFLRQRAREVRTGRYVADEDVTVLHAIDDYLHRGESRWSSNTRAEYHSIRNRIGNHAIAKVRLSDLTPRQCQHWVDDMVAVYSPARLVVLRAVVSGALREAMRLGVINTNPMAGVRMPSPKPTAFDVWTPQQALHALDMADGDPLLFPYYVVALNTCMRPGEIRALMWSDIDMEKGWLTVSRTMTRDADYSPVVGTTTKGGKSRRIAISDDVVDVLRQHKVRQTERRLRAPAWHNAGLVFDRGNGSPLPQQTIAKRHKRFATEHDLPVCRLHDLRHSSASFLMQAGIPIKVVSEMLGHASISITMDIYGHTNEDQQRQAAETMRALLSSRKGHG